MNPILSIIIPIYNGERYLEECLESLAGQNFGDIEMICVDDGSTDQSLSIVKKWQSKDNRMRIIQQPNSGPSAARNKGMEAACGKYITFVDSDDLVRQDIYTTSIPKMEEHKLDAYCFAIESFPNGNVRATNFPTDKVMNHQQLFASNERIQSENALCYSVRFVFRSTIIKENHLHFNEDIRYGEDMLFNIDAICHSQRIMFSNEPFYQYRKNAMGAMSKPFKPHLEESLVKAYDIKMEQIERYGLQHISHYKKDIAEYYIKVFLPMLITNEYRRPDKCNYGMDIKHVLSLKMFRDSFKTLGFKNIYPTTTEYLFYLAQKFKLYSIVQHIYRKNLQPS